MKINASTTQTTIPATYVSLRLLDPLAFKLGEVVHLDADCAIDWIRPRKPHEPSVVPMPRVRIDRLERAPWDAAAPVRSRQFEGHDVAQNSHVLQGRFELRDVQGLDIREQDEVHLTAALEVVRIDHSRNRDGLVVRVHHWRTVLVLRTPFDDAIPTDDGLRRPGPHQARDSLGQPGGRDGRRDGAADVVDDLVYYRQLEPVVVRCPHRDLDRVNRRTGELVPLGCHRLACGVCCWTRAFRVGAAIGLAAPSHHLLLTRTGRTYEELAARMKCFFRVARRAEPGLQYCFHVEPSADGQTHVHMWLHGVSGQDAWIAVAAEAAGMGPFHELAKRRMPLGEPLGYGLKMITRAPRRRDLSAEAQKYLELNGHRLVHTSRRFWRDRDGTPLPGISAAEKRAGKFAAGDDWAIVSATITAA